MAPNFETNKTILFNLATKKSAIDTGLRAAKQRNYNPSLAEKVFTKLQIRMYEVFKESYPETVVVEIKPEEYLDANGTITRRDISELTPDQIVPHSLVNQIEYVQRVIQS
jgi:hypothetical protein